MFKICSPGTLRQFFGHIQLVTQLLPYIWWVTKMMCLPPPHCLVCKVIIHHKMGRVQKQLFSQ